MGWTSEEREEGKKSEMGYKRKGTEGRENGREGSGGMTEGGTGRQWRRGRRITSEGREG